MGIRTRRLKEDRNVCELGKIFVYNRDFAAGVAASYIEPGEIVSVQAINASGVLTVSRAIDGDEEFDLFVALDQIRETGRVTSWCVVEDDTSGVLAGDPCYLDPTTSGAYTFTRPPGDAIRVGFALDSAAAGHVYLNPRGQGANKPNSGDDILVASGTIANAAVRTLNATPVQMIAAPGAGRYIEGVSLEWFLDYTAPAFDNAVAGETLEAKYTNGAGAALFDAVAGDAIGVSAADYHTLVQPVPEVVQVANAAVVAHINAGEWFAAAGNSDLKWRMLYRVRSLLT